MWNVIAGGNIEFQTVLFLSLEDFDLSIVWLNFGCRICDHPSFPWIDLAMSSALRCFSYQYLDFTVQGLMFVNVHPWNWILRVWFVQKFQFLFFQGAHCTCFRDFLAGCGWVVQELQGLLLNFITGPLSFIIFAVLRTEKHPKVQEKWNKHQEKLGGGNSNIFSVSPLLGGIDPIRLIFFGWVETTNYRKQMQLMHSPCVSFLPGPRSCFSFVMYVWANTKLTNLSEKIQVLRRYNFMRPVSVVNKYAYDAVWL